MKNNDANLDLLALLHYVVAGICALFACFPLIHVGLGLLMVSGKFVKDSNGSAPPLEIGWLFVGIGTMAILFGWALAVMIFIAGKSIKKRKHRTFCVVVAALECLFMPLGTVLGVFTLINLTKDEISALFEDGTTH